MSHASYKLTEPPAFPRGQKIWKSSMIPVGGTSRMMAPCFEGRRVTCQGSSGAFGTSDGESTRAPARPGRTHGATTSPKLKPGSLCPATGHPRLTAGMTALTRCSGPTAARARSDRAPRPYIELRLSRVGEENVSGALAHRPRSRPAPPPRFYIKAWPSSSTPPAPYIGDLHDI